MSTLKDLEKEEAEYDYISSTIGRVFIELEHYYRALSWACENDPLKVKQALDATKDSFNVDGDKCG